MTIMNAAFTVGAMLSGSAIETPGLLFVENGSNYSITSCTAETVVVTGSIADSLLRPGQILVYIASESDHSKKPYDDGFICNSCSPLFRKIVARSESNSDSEDTYTTKFATTFATFSEIFPENFLLDESLADAYLEPQFDCGHSTFEEREHRELRSSSDDGNGFGFGIPDIGVGGFFGGWYCGYLPPLMAILRCSGCCLPCCIPCIFVLINFALILLHGCAARRRLYTEVEGGETEKEAETESFPETCEDWINTDSNGNCLYVDCNIADMNYDGQDNPSGQGCFSFGNNSLPENLTGLPFDLNNIVTFHGSGNDFSEALCAQDYCYSSKFSKKACDNNVYKAMTNKCISLGAKSTSTMRTTFPLAASAISQNCHILSMVFYLNMKLLGHLSYNHLQLKQAEYQQTMCKTNGLTDLHL